MPLLQHIRAALILAIFIAGVIVAPLSHYAYMAWEGVPGTEHDASHHAGMGHEAPASHTPSGPALRGDIEHIQCDYWSLFATFAAVAASGNFALFSPSEKRRDTPRPQGEPCHACRATAFLRGPPVA